MPKFRVRFFKHLVNASGAPFKAPQRSIDALDAKNAADAEQIAKRHFERFEGISHWRLRADTIETEINGETSDPVILSSGRGHHDERARN